MKGVSWKRGGGGREREVIMMFFFGGGDVDSDVVLMALILWTFHIN